MKKLMTRLQFNEQLAGAHEMTDSEAHIGQERRINAGQKMVKYGFLRPGDKGEAGLWYCFTDIREADGVAPYFAEIEGKVVRGIGVWRCAIDQMCESSGNEV